MLQRELSLGFTKKKLRPVDKLIVFKKNNFHDIYQYIISSFAICIRGKNKKNGF